MILMGRLEIIKLKCIYSGLISSNHFTSKIYILFLIKSVNFVLKIYLETVTLKLKEDFVLLIYLAYFSRYIVDPNPSTGLKGPILKSLRPKYVNPEAHG